MSAEAKFNPDGTAPPDQLEALGLVGKQEDPNGADPYGADPYAVGGDPKADPYGTD